LADGSARIDFEIPLGEFVRLRLAADEAREVARGHAQFSRDLGFVIAEVEVHATLPLTCQRCLGVMRLPVNSRSRVMLVGSEGEADNAPAGIETVLALERRISMRELAEEELLLSVPIVPLHADPRECAAAMPRETAAGERTDVQRPFERLGELLKRDR